MYEIKITTRFAAAHQLRMIRSKCENLHGHNWKVEVCVKGDKLNELGIIMDFSDLKKQVAQVIEQLDHQFLNDLDFFKDRNPSSEHIAYFIANQINARIEKNGVKVSHVTAWESEDACATYYIE